MRPTRLACAAWLVGLLLIPGAVWGQSAATPTLPETIPIFPLPDAVLFPNVSLGLFIFEPRYRTMLDDAMKGDGIIGMVQLKPGWEANYTGRPPINPIGCAGVITQAEGTADGRIRVVLQGLVKFRVTGEETGRTYRLARVDALPEEPDEQERAALSKQRQRLQALLTSPDAGSQRTLPDVSDEELINAFSQYLNVSAPERQALLERPGLLSRSERLIELMEKLKGER